MQSLFFFHGVGYVVLEHVWFRLCANQFSSHVCFLEWVDSIFSCLPRKTNLFWKGIFIFQIDILTPQSTLWRQLIGYGQWESQCVSYV
jgi:hypothetical protein